MFLALVTLGYVSGIMLALIQSGMTPHGIATYYLGDETRLIFPKSYRGLLETTHFHLFSASIIFLVLTHLFLLSQLSHHLKIWLICLTFGGLLAEIASPWLIRYNGAGWSWMMAVSGPLLSLGSLAMVAILIREIWFIGLGTGGTENL